MFLDEMASFTGQDGMDLHDDIVDASSLAFNHLAKSGGMWLA
jgi:phage terminase large subunit-like protein